MTARMTCAVLLAAAAAQSAAGQPASKGLPPPPPGFKAFDPSPSQVAMKAAGVNDGVLSEKSNESWPGCIVDPKIQFNYGWTAVAGGNQVVEITAQSPEEPARVIGGIRDEPAGKQRYQNGVLIWRKITTLAAGTNKASCPGNQVITYEGKWIGFSSGKLAAVSVSRLYGAKASGQAWIDEYIPKVISAASGR